MCFGGGGSQPKAPDPVPVLPPPKAPEPPPQVQNVKPPQTIKVDQQLGIVKRESSAEAANTVAQGTSQLRIPLNVGTGKAGGLNI